MLSQKANSNEGKPAANQVFEKANAALDRLDGCENRFQHDAFNDERACKTRRKTPRLLFGWLELLLHRVNGAEERRG